MNHYELTGAQRQIAALARSSGTEDLVIDAVSMHSSEKAISVGSIERALRAIVAVHDVFRVELRTDSHGNLQQVFLDEPADHIEVVALDDDSALSLWRLDTATPLSLRGSPWMIQGFTLGRDRYGIRIRMHHVIADAYAVGLLMNQFHSHFDSSPDAARVPTGSYQKAITDGLEYLRGQRFANDVAAWSSAASGASLTAPWPIRETGSDSDEVERTGCQLGAPLSDLLRAFASRERVSVAATVMACAAHILTEGRHEGQIAVGTTFHGRRSLLERTTVGMFANTAPVIVFCGRDESFADFVRKIDFDRLRAARHDRANLTLLRQLAADVPDAPAMRCEIIVNDLSHLHSPDPDVAIDWSNSGTQSNAVTVSITSWGGNGRLQLDYDYRRDTLTTHDVQRLNDRVVTILTAALADPALPISSHTSLRSSDRAALAILNQHHAASYQEDATVLSLWASAVADFPGQIAVVGDGVELSYEDVEKTANRIARTLTARGVEAGDRVVLLGARIPLLIPAILGVVKARASYVPIEPDQPSERLLHVIVDAQPKVIVTLAEQNALPPSSIPVLNLSVDALSDDDSPITDPHRAESELYVIYTSGTSGLPKGVRVSHGNVVRLLRSEHHPCRFLSDDTWLLFHSFAFDFSVWEMYGALLNGGRLVVPSHAQTRDPFALAALIERTGVTILNQVPSSFYALSRWLDGHSAVSVRCIIFGGEALDPRKIADWAYRNPSVELVNMFGITETTVHVTYKQVRSGVHSHDVGRPLPTSGVVLLNGDAIAGVDEPGEICVYGAGVALGYLNRPEVDATRFVSVPGYPGRTYRSGDLGKLTSEGTLEHLGRIDSQVKVNGFRIELGEIEAQVQRTGGIRASAVVGPGGGMRGIHVFYETDEGVTPDSLLADLRTRLPEYMLPKHCVQIDHLPITTNGKLDVSALRALLERQEKERGTDSVPVTGLAAVLVEVYEEILDVRAPAVDEQFHALGGDSIQSMMIAARLRERGYALSPQDVSAVSTIADVVPLIRVLDDGTPPSSSMVEPHGVVAPTPMTRQFQRLRTDAPAQHNQSVVLTFADTADLPRMAQAWAEIVERHPILHAQWDGQTLTIPEKRDLEEFSLQTRYVRDDKAHDVLLREMNTGFNLARGPLIRAVIARGDGRPDRLLLVAHHLVIDAISWRVLAYELQQRVLGRNLAQPQSDESSFRNWAHTLNEFAGSPRSKPHRDFARGVYRTTRDDRDSTLACTRSEAYRERLTLAASILEDAAIRCQQRYGMDLAQTLAASAATSLAIASKRTHLIVEVESHGRTELAGTPDVSSTIGWFTLTYLAQLQLDEDLELSLIECKDRLTVAARHAVGDGLLDIGNEAIRDFVPDLTFNYLGNVADVLGQRELFCEIDLGSESDRSPGEAVRSRFIVDVLRRQDGFSVEITADANTHSPEVVSRFRKTFIAVLETAARATGTLTTATDVGADDMSAHAWAELRATYEMDDFA